MMLSIERSLRRQKETGFRAYLGRATSSWGWREGGDDGVMRIRWKPMEAQEKA